MEPQVDLDPPEPGEGDAPDGDGTTLDGDDGGTGTTVDDDPDSSQSTTTDGDSSTGDGDGDGEGGEGDGDGEGSASGKPSAFDALLAKYDGDKEKLAEGIWEQSKSLSQMNQRLDQLQETLQQAVAIPEEDVEAIIGEDPYVKEAANELRTNDSKLKEAQQDQAKIIGEHGKLEKQVAKLEGKLSSAAPEDKDEIREDLREAKSDRKEAARNYRDSRRDIEGLKKELRGNAKNFREAEANAKDRLDRERQSAQTQRDRSVGTRQDFTDAVVAEAKKHGIPTDGQTFKVLHQSVKDRITGYLRTLPKGAPGIDIPEAVGVIMEEFVDAMALKSRFQKGSTRKRGQVDGGTTQRATGKGVTAPTVKGDQKGDWSAAYVRKRAKQLLGG